MGTFILVLIRLVEASAWTYSLVVVARAVVSWMPLHGGHPLRRCLEAVTEPVLRPIRRMLGRLGLMRAVDWSPLVLLLCVYLIRDLLVRMLLQLVLP